MSSSIVFIHLGPIIPAFTGDAIKQAARFSAGPLYLVAERAAIAAFPLPDVPRIIAIACEDLGISPLHQAFRDRCPFNKSFRNGFWIHTTERFYYLATLAERRGLQNVVHLENDVMLYTDTEHLVAKVGRLYEGIAVPFDNDDRSVPSLLFARRPQALTALCQFIVELLRERPDPNLNDMILLALARRRLGPSVLNALPILPPFYSGPLRNKIGDRTKEPDLFSRHVSHLGVVFDAAAIGQYLGGPDPRNFQPPKQRWYHFLKGRNRGLPPPGPGFVNQDCLFDSSFFAYAWGTDAQGRRVPYMMLNEAQIPIANLHIHSKYLARFSS